VAAILKILCQVLSCTIDPRGSTTGDTMGRSYDEPPNMSRVRYKRHIHKQQCDAENVSRFGGRSRSDEAKKVAVIDCPDAVAFCYTLVLRRDDYKHPVTFSAVVRLSPTGSDESCDRNCTITNYDRRPLSTNNGTRWTVSMRPRRQATKACNLYETSPSTCEQSTNS
jgi:hypothetical protein